MKKTEIKKLVIPVKLEWVKNPGKIPVKDIYESRPASSRFTARLVGDKYLMASQKLGWINCDRFLNKQKRRREFFVEMDSTSDASVRIVFNDVNSVMGGFRFSKGFLFMNVPEGERVTVIALKFNGSNFELGTKECLITEEPVRDLQFIPVDKEMMEYKFNQIVSGSANSLAINNRPFSELQLMI